MTAKPIPLGTIKLLQAKGKAGGEVQVKLDGWKAGIPVSLLLDGTKSLANVILLRTVPPR